MSLSLKEVTDFCRVHNMTESRFGRNAVNDPRLVSEMRKGVQLQEARIEKIRRYMKQFGDAQGE